jgi:AmiR/NasT family two-component response regulator
VDSALSTECGDMFRPSSLRVLVADDDQLAAFSLHAQLAHLGYQVVAEAANRQEAIALVRQLHPDLVVVDINVPDVDGLGASEQIDRDGLCPIILVSAYSGRELVQKACSLPAVQAYLVKPVNEEDLEPAIELALDRFRQTQELQRLKESANILGTRLDLEQAEAYLAANRHCSVAEAERWIQQEARAKKASLDQVAKAIIAGETVGYHYDMPT